MKKNMKLFIIVKLEYGAGQENVFSEILNVTSSRSTAKVLKEHYMEEYADEIQHSHDNRWISIQLQECGVQIDDEIIEPEIFVRYIEGSSRTCRDDAV